MIAFDQQGETTMVDLEVSVEGVALDALDAFLSSDQSPPDSMMLSDVDGFLTAIAIGPELIMPSEWLPVIWGDDEPVFTDEAQMQAVLGGILSRTTRSVARSRMEPLSRSYGVTRTAQSSAPTGLRDSCRVSACAQQNGSDCSDLRTALV